MTEELKSAIVTIAQYDGYTVYPDDAFIMPASMSHQKFSNLPGYSTSADVLLPVLNKLEQEIRNGITEDMEKTQFERKYDILKHLWSVEPKIIRMDYPSACIKLAQIISQLNKQK